MQNNRFVVLTGHLSNYPLSDLVGILRHQRKSGRLLIEYPKGPATFFFQNGELIDARMNDLIGLQAICVALAQPEASFNFNPLIQSPRRTIDPSLQRAVSELFGCWDESALQIETTPAAPSLEGSTSASAGIASRTLPGRRSELLALPPGPTFTGPATLRTPYRRRRRDRDRTLYGDCRDWRLQRQPGCGNAVTSRVKLSLRPLRRRLKSQKAQLLPPLSNPIDRHRNAEKRSATSRMKSATRNL